MYLTPAKCLVYSRSWDIAVHKPARCQPSQSLVGQTSDKQIRILPGSYTCRAENQKRVMRKRITEVIREGLSVEVTS